jgi:hypothetical protein
MTPDASSTPQAPSQASGATAAAASTDDSNLPACSRTVTDKCVQKGGSGHHAAGKHHATKHHAAPKKK